jgi:hypothetical protein
MPDGIPTSIYVVIVKFARPHEGFFRRCLCESMVVARGDIVGKDEGQ